MPEKKKREKVTAEISIAHLIQFAADAGRTLSVEDALIFLNQEGRAYEMWKLMMEAGERYVKSSLQSRSAMLIRRQSGAGNRMAM